ncbi:MAG: ankyrin repeat domain-containing protein [Bacteroidota bacterium]
MLRPILLFSLSLACLASCLSNTPEVDEEITAPADSVKVIAGYDISHLQLTEADLDYEPQKMTKHHVLGLACVHCDSALMVKALAAGADPALQTQGLLPFLEAALCPNNYASLLPLLMDHGVDVNMTDYNGETALNYAIARELYPTIDFLLEKGASLTLKDAMEGYGCSPIFSANTPEMIEFLQERGADFSTSCNSGVTLLHLAVENDYTELIVYILEEELVDPKAVNEYGETAYDYATHYARGEAQDLLRAYR